MSTVSTNPRQLAPTEGIPLAEGPVKKAVERLHELVGKATLQMAMAVGAIITEEFYDGNVARLHGRTFKGENSLRALAEHPDLPFTAATLYRYVSVFELVTRTDGLQAFPTLTASHFRAALPAPVDEQPALLQAAEVEGWSVRQIDAEVAKFKRSKGGRPRLAPVVKAVRAVNRTLDGQLGNLRNMRDLHGLSAKEVKELHTRVVATIATLGELAQVLRPEQRD